jgi:protein TorT
VGPGEEVEYTSLSRDEVTDAWSLCAALPHLKDSIWIGSNYGLVSQAQRLDVNLAVVEAGGYENLSDQVAQIEDCVSSGADAILVGAVSYDSLNPVLEQARARGVAVIDYGNGVSFPDADGRVVVDYRDMGAMIGRHLADSGENMNVAVFPGPAGVGWSERSLAGFEEAIEGSGITVVDTKYGDTGREVQLSLVEDALAANPDLDALIGNAPMLEAASSVLAEQGKTDQVKLYGTYTTPETLKLMEGSRVGCGSVELTAQSGELAIDLAVRVLQEQYFMQPNARVATQPIVLCGPAEGAANNLEGFDRSTTFAPEGWSPVSVVKSTR